MQSGWFHPGFCRGLLLLFLNGSLLQAEDWPQWRGPARDSTWREQGIVQQLPDQPEILWQTKIAGGYAGPAVANGRVFVTDYVTSDNVKVANFDRQEFSGVERVLCLDEQTGKELWKHEYPVKYSISYPAGPRCTPLVHEGHVFTLGAEGDLIAFEASSGQIKWSVNLPQRYQTKTPLWGYAAHPLIDGNKLITLAGGPGSHAVALDWKTGQELWRTLTVKEQGYAPPLIINAAGIRQLILAQPEGISSVNPETGEPYWTEPYEASNGSIIMTPVQRDNLLFVGGFNNKNILIELNQDQPAAKTIFRDRPRAAISPVNVQPLVDGDLIYGFDQNGFLYAIDFATGERLWQSAAPLNSERPLGSGTAFLTRHQDRYFLFTELGELKIAQISREGYTELDSMPLLKPTNVAFGRDVLWSAPAFANKCVFVRNDEACIRVNLAAPQ